MLRLSKVLDTKGKGVRGRAPSHGTMGTFLGGTKTRFMVGYKV